MFCQLYSVGATMEKSTTENGSNNLSIVNGWSMGAEANGSNNYNGPPGGNLNCNMTGPSTSATCKPGLDGPEGNGDLETSSSVGENGLTSNGCHSGSPKKEVAPSKCATTKTATTDLSSALSDEDSDDDYCVYTYKGGNRENQQLADLPSSFYQFDSSDNQSDDLTSHPGEAGGSSGIFRNQIRFSDPSRRLQNISGSNVNGAFNGAPDVFSPDMDFLEMDFDPSGYADPDGNDYSSPDDECVNVVNIAPANTDRLHSDSRVSPGTRRNDITSCGTSANTETPSASNNNCPSPSSVIKPLNSLAFEPEASNSASERAILSSDRNSEPSVTKRGCVCGSDVDKMPNGSNNLSIGGSSVAALKTHGDNNNIINLAHSETQSTLRLVKSNTLPQLAAKPNNNAFSNDASNFRSSERSSIMFSSVPVFRKFETQSTSYKARINASEEPNEDSVELEVGSIMIWNIQEAREMAFNQIGTSACGATALLNVLKAIKMDASPDFVNSCVGTRLRAESADLPQYLFSRSCAGATHTDLISGINRASNGLIYARFFPIKKTISISAFNNWILQWICKDAIPVVTRNLQIASFSSPQDIPDSWHHQMVFGVSPEGLFLNNPIECVPASALLPQITSDSVLLVRRQDIINHKSPTTDLRQLARHEDPRWNEVNVLGQVANILLEEIPYFSENTAARRVRSSHIKIPAEYTAGVTLFVLRDTPSCQQLQNAKDPSN